MSHSKKRHTQNARNVKKKTQNNINYLYIYLQCSVGGEYIGIQIPISDISPKGISLLILVWKYVRCVYTNSWRAHNSVLSAANPRNNQNKHFPEACSCYARRSSRQKEHIFVCFASHVILHLSSVVVNWKWYCHIRIA